MAARSKARKRALDYLFAAEMKAISPVEVLETEVADGRRTVHPYTDVLVRGVVEHQARLDRLISTYSHSWTLDRMPAVDRNALRIGLWEVLYADDVPDVVAVDEAVTLVKDLSTDESPAFVNGVLDALRRERDTLPDAPPEEPAAEPSTPGEGGEGSASPVEPAGP